MAVSTPQDVHPKTGDAGSSLQETARKHLWMHFSRMGGYDDAHEARQLDAEVEPIVRLSAALGQAGVSQDSIAEAETRARAEIDRAAESACDAPHADPRTGKDHTYA